MVQYCRTSDPHVGSPETALWSTHTNPAPEKRELSNFKTHPSSYVCRGKYNQHPQITESHQSAKADTSGTAKALAADFATLTGEEYDVESIKKASDPGQGARPSPETFARFRGILFALAVRVSLPVSCASGFGQVVAVFFVVSFVCFFLPFIFRIFVEAYFLLPPSSRTTTVRRATLSFFHLLLRCPAICVSLAWFLVQEVVHPRL